jgi:hypothetical protein
MMPIVLAGLVSSGLCSLLLATGSRGDSALGVPSYWPWLLTGLQVLSLWTAGQGSAWGWLLGGSVQLPWIVYALLTAQPGFIPGCAISAAVQLHSFRGNRPLMMRSSAGVA